MLRTIVLILVAAFAAHAQTVETANPGPQPMNVGLLVDNSGSYRLLLERVINVVADLVDKKQGDDDMFLMTFVDTTKIVLRQPFTHIKSELHAAADDMFIEGGQTAILDALLFAAKQFDNAPPERTRALILISDGDERSSAAKIADVLKALKDAKIRVYTIGLADDRLNTKFLERIARETGGATFIPKTPSETADILGRVWPAMRAVK